MRGFKNIYNQPRRYAKKCNIPLKYAREICKKQLKLQREIRKNSICPYCKKRDLEMDWADCEYSNDSWVWCNNCGREIDEELFPKVTVPNIGEDFDVILWASHDKDMEFTTQDEWVKFVKQHK